MERALNIVLLRGLVREAGHWLGFRDALAAAFPGSAVLPVDLLGNGAYHREPTPVSIPAIVEAARRDFLAAVASPSLAGRPAVVLAISLGGMVAFEWMRRYPADFERAAIGNSSLRGLSPVLHRLRPAAWPTILRAATARDPVRRERLILSIISNRREVHGEIALRWAEIGRARPVSRESLVRQILAAATYVPSAEPPPVPVLLLNGAKDRLVEPACSAALARAWGLPLEIHPEAGHDLAIDAPEWLLERLVRWFGAPHRSGGPRDERTGVSRGFTAPTPDREWDASMKKPSAELRPRS